MRHLHSIYAAALAALAVSGCVSPAFRESVGQFGTLTKATVDAQNERLAAVTADEQERIRRDLAHRHVQLALSRDCPLVMAVPEQDAPTADNVPAAAESDVADGVEQPAELPQCRLVAIHSPPQPIAEAARYENIVALSTALSNYSESLVALAADSPADRAAFATSLSQLATSVGGLNGAIRKAVGAPDADLNAKLGAVATFVAEAGNLYFAYQRDRALRQIIIRAGPFVERAVALLVQADQSLDLFERTKLMAALRTAQQNAAAVAADTANSDAAVRAAQDQAFAALDQFNRANAAIQPFRAIGVAHVRLVRAARSGASAAELRAAVDAIIHLASTAHDTIETLRGSNGSSDHAN